MTDAAQAHRAVDAALAKFGRIDVLVNNAGYGQLGAFEENETGDIEQQYATNVFGLFHVTRAVLPVMRRQRGGHIFNVSSMAGVLGFASASIYCSAKFAVEGFSESLALEVAQFGINVTIVEPGFFRTDFLDGSSVRYGNKVVEDYVPSSTELKAAFDNHSYKQAGDPVKLGKALVHSRQHRASAAALCRRLRRGGTHRRQARRNAERDRSMARLVGLDRPRALTREGGRTSRAAASLPRRDLAEGAR